MTEPFAFRTPVSIPEIGADAGDWIEYSPRRPNQVYIIKVVPKHMALDTFSRIRSLTAALPPEQVKEVPPVGRSRLEVVRG